MVYVVYVRCGLGEVHLVTVGILGGAHVFRDVVDHDLVGDWCVGVFGLDEDRC